MKNNSIKINFIMNFILTSSSILFPLITFPYVSRILLPAGTGKVAFATSVISYFTMIAMLGVPTYGIRACARVRENKEELSRTAQELLIINLVMAFISYIAFFISLAIVPQLESQKVLLIVCSTAIILNVFGVSWLYQALEQYTYITFASMLFKVIALILMFLFVRNLNNYVIYGAITVISSFGSYILNCVRLKKFIYLHPVGNYNFKRHIKPIGVFFAMTVATTVYTNLDTVMLGIMKNDEVVGIYNAAIKVKSLMVSLVTSLGTVLLPRLSYYYEQKMFDEFKEIISKAFSFVLLFAIPCCIYFIIYSKEIVLFLSGEAFLDSIIPMCILMPTIVLIGLSNITGIQVLVPSGNERKVFYSVAVGAILDFGINILLIPSLGASGAAIGTLVAEFFVLAFQLCSMKNLMSTVVKKIEFKQLTISIIPATVVLILFHDSITFSSVFISLAISAILFFAIYGFMLLMSKEEIIISIFNNVRHR